MAFPKDYCPKLANGTRKLQPPGRSTPPWSIWAPFISTGTGVPKDYAEARKWYEKAAAAGNAGAMNRARRCLLQRRQRRTPVDDAEARKWYEKAAAAGNANAMNNLGDLYFNGNQANPQGLCRSSQMVREGRSSRKPSGEG